MKDLKRRTYYLVYQNRLNLSAEEKDIVFKYDNLMTKLNDDYYNWRKEKENEQYKII